MNEKEFWRLHHIRVFEPDHPNSHKSGTIYEHRLTVEAVIGRYLNGKELVHHHYNSDGSATLVLCPDQNYHWLLHQRELALKIAGNANFKKCRHCKCYDDPINMSTSKWAHYHKACANAHDKARKLTNL